MYTTSILIRGAYVANGALRRKEVQSYKFHHTALNYAYWYRWTSCENILKVQFGLGRIVSI